MGLSFLPGAWGGCAGWLAGAVLLFATLHDVAFRTIPNWMPAAIVLLGCGLRALDGTVGLGLFVFVPVLSAGCVCWRQGWLGGGDVKLLAACALLVPPQLGVAYLLDVAIAGGVLALVYLALSRLPQTVARSRPSSLLPRILRVERRRISRRGPLPYACAIAAGALLTLTKGS